MIEIIVNLVPFGIRSRTRQIASMKIWNDATGDHETGNYGYKMMNEKGRVVSAGELKGFKRERGVQYLIKEILDDAL
jgi:hypothetical protein